ncbi:MAG: DUF192 domain-containing protein [Gemmatimonadota bacterium]
MHRFSHLWKLVILLWIGACGAPGAGSGGSGSQDASAASATTALDSAPRPSRGHAWVIFGADTVVAEVAATADARARGLMHRESLPHGTGMLFVFPDSQTRSFWMRNTFIPLDIAYLDSSLRIVDIQAMEPEDENLYPSAAPAMYALEVPQGWFAGKEISVGATAELVMGLH